LENRIKKGGTKIYREKVYIGHRAITSPWFIRITDAREWKAQKVSDRRKNLMGDAPLYKTNIPIREFCQIWLKEKPINSKRTFEGYSADVRNHISPLLGDLTLRELSPLHGNKLIQELKGKKLSDRTINKTLTVFKTILNDAVKWNYIPKSPLLCFPEIKEKPKPDVYWTEPEIRQFLRANINDPHYELYVVTLNTGLRLGEILALCWDRVNFAQGQLVISRIMTRHGLEETTKTHKIRAVPINVTTRGMLERLIKKQKSQTYVFTRPDGRPIRYQKFSENFFRKAQFKAGIGRIITFHSLRHTYASQFMMNKGNIFDLQKILGHSSIEMTKRYAHLSNEHLLKASNIISFSGEDSTEIAPKADFSENVLMISAR
jgi:integrase